MTNSQGGAPCGPSNRPSTNSPSAPGKLNLRNRAAASLADARFRPRRTRDKTKEHPRQGKHKGDEVDN